MSNISRKEELNNLLVVLNQVKEAKENNIKFAYIEIIGKAIDKANELNFGICFSDLTEGQVTALINEIKKDGRFKDLNDRIKNNVKEVNVFEINTIIEILWCCILTPKQIKNMTPYSAKKEKSSKPKVRQLTLNQIRQINKTGSTRLYPEIDN